MESKINYKIYNFEEMYNEGHQMFKQFVQTRIDRLLLELDVSQLDRNQNSHE